MHHETPSGFGPDFTDPVLNILKSLGEDPNREGLLDTPARVNRAMRELFSGYFAPDNTPDVLCSRVFTDSCDEMIVQTGVPVYSFCEHHMLPFFGTASVAYIPSGKVIGASKIPRLVDYFARRLQIQEHLTTQIATTLQEKLGCLGVAVVVRCLHLCMVYRGARVHDCYLRTSKMMGVFADDTSHAKAEFLSLCATEMKPLL